MPREDIVVGLDIGDARTKAAVGVVTESGRIEIVGVGRAPSRGLRSGVVVNIESTIKSIVGAIDEAEIMSGREISEVCVGVAGSRIEGINSRGVVAVAGRNREIDQRDIDRVIEAARAIAIPMDREVLHVLPREFIVDDQRGIKSPLNMIGIRLEAEVHIITSSVTTAQNLLQAVNRSGFPVEELVLESMAAARAILTNDETEMGVMLIDMGAGTTDLIVLMEGTPFHTSVVPLGGNQITNDLSVMLKTPFETAERLKHEAGCCREDMIGGGEEILLPGVGGWPSATIPRVEFCRIIAPRMAEILNLVKKEVKDLGILNHLGGGLVLTGGNAQIPGAVEMAQDIFDLPARLGLPREIGGLIDEIRDPSLSVCVGLVIQGARQIAAENETLAGRRREGLPIRFREWVKGLF